LGSQIESVALPATPQDFVELLGNLPQMDSAGSNDFNVYRKENLTVRVGERAIVTLMTKKIKYGHRYRWNTNDSIEHLLTMKNNSTTPWTTGPCLTLSESQPLSEDSLRYTPPGAVGEIKVTTAINIASEITERESDRDLKSHEVGNGQYLDRVVVSGTIRVKSFEDKPIELIVSQPILGRPLEASGTGKIKTDAEKLRLVERNGSIGWTVNLVPGEEQTLSYTYERYVPSN
jgi:hypothetical protein